MHTIWNTSYDKNWALFFFPHFHIIFSNKINLISIDKRCYYAITSKLTVLLLDYQNQSIIISFIYNCCIIILPWCIFFLSSTKHIKSLHYFATLYSPYQCGSFDSYEHLSRTPDRTLISIQRVYHCVRELKFKLKHQALKRE